MDSNPALVFRIAQMWVIPPEHSTENWNVICSLKSLCTQQIVGLDIFSTSALWVSLVDSVQQSLIPICPFLYHFWSKMDLGACFCYCQSLMKLSLLCCGSLGQLPQSRQMRGWFDLPRCVCKSPLPTAAWFGELLPHSWVSAGCVEFTLKEKLELPWWCSGHRSCCAMFHLPVWGRVGGEWHCWKRANCLLFPQRKRGKTFLFAQAGGWHREKHENWDGVVILHFPQLVFTFCVMQNDCNWECIWDKLPLWLSNMSALLFYVYMSGL